MVDIFDPEHRSWNMSQIRGQNTVPEKQVRRLLHGMGFRFRNNVRNLPGKPDVVLARHRTVILVHGCFWHRHPKCRFCYTPRSNVDFWTKKFEETVRRDQLNKRALRKLGWRIVTVWECELGRPDRLCKKLKNAIERDHVKSPLASESGYRSNRLTRNRVSSSVAFFCLQA